MKKSNVLAGLALLAVTATVSAGQLPHTGPASVRSSRPRVQLHDALRAGPIPCQVNRARVDAAVSSPDGRRTRRPLSGTAESSDEAKTNNRNE
jgi:hypothetical protein